ncbi:hypothetical protein AF335_09005 [Streptomyces eurocidicus]|uniref:Uncharacterized protein n=1 Tax=Streptomyces eurocidicus TaxID=66423 RepID=A0A2N8P0W2_STREU|nr:hypothetical protein [Streptomyces eurocidicus]PNE34657.1 hypothetical protein AF335_09005 [Streptomyces eurocidicus]
MWEEPKREVRAGGRGAGPGTTGPAGRAAGTVAAGVGRGTGPATDDTAGDVAGDAIGGSSRPTGAPAKGRDAGVS